MAYAILFKPSAEKQFGRLPRAAKERLQPLIDGLVDDPHPQCSERLKGHDGLRRLRSGIYRLIYTEPDGDGEILVLKVAHRREVYRGL